ncbi:MAG: hypothetical protein H0T41_01970 [Rhodobacteraceae bacterium]|nr:hypothetical protein [Paracoccaceae bacterium]
MGSRSPPETLRAIGEGFLITDLDLAAEPKPDFGAIPLTDAQGEALAYAVWTPPAPGRAVLRAMLWPLLGLALLLAAVAFHVSRELVASARRLEVALHRAQAADRSKTQFLANVSHELRTPMNGVIGIAQLLQMQDLGPESRELLAVLLASAHTQIQLINGLLDITRIETGSMELDAAPFDPAAAVEEIVGLLGPEAQAKGLALTARIAPAARAGFVGDAVAVRQVLANLIGNAIKFTGAGQVTVELVASAGTDGLALSVTDTGRGVAPEDQARIFERFVQVDGSLTRTAGGAGLGLAITRSLVELMGGTIRVESALGRGATFLVALPLARSTAPPRQLAA